MLKVTGLNAYYDRSHVVQDIAFDVAQGEIVTLMGRNGAGKTTTLRTLMGLLGKRSGSMVFDGHECLMQPPHTRFHMGLAYVPEDRRIVPGLTVRENLELGLIASKDRGRMTEMVDEIAETFPRLKERLHQEGTSMSGGEQQMLAIARAMMARPKMILLDEPSEGIMPILVDEMFELFLRLKQRGTTILLVEQNVERALSISDRAYILDQGEIVHTGTAAELLADQEIQERYCAV
ncbi:ABC transporter ATP-binding protein [Noviherbaspirillum suwonense]|jgi:branched-chain amino acid transport system ATP-binding protein|uniref:Amino acid/amide ABC transporter ATP-binding protein 2, HAAT family n=1 Tax=Noviherbaspirillum suwonense TaxID=1224511 RepID=A0ABY1Q8R6_9BURK|nr:ABC transporter ATP-binding protein [Noviherbaspirillum suwonense]SMP63339.1 amino acid/amide ABC transporter ATP-binding protein 2, HAAT family [Noviherbaspirillum suwonense]